MAYASLDRDQHALATEHRMTVPLTIIRRKAA
jgi:hypothetical protein